MNPLPTPPNSSPLFKLLMRHENLKLSPYLDSAGLMTIGVGRCIDKIGITIDEAMYLLMSDIKRATEAAQKNCESFESLSQARKDALIDMAFNLGIAGLGEFKAMLGAIAKNDFSTAAKEMLQSKWATQVGNRAKELAELMEHEVYPN